MAKNTTMPKPTSSENPRTTRIRDIVLPAVMELLVAEGAGAVTALRVSEHAGVARSTIYQHWPDQNTLLLDAIDRMTTPHVPTSISDNLEDDITAALGTLRKRITTQPFRALFATLLDHANRDRAFVGAQRRFVTRVLQPIRDVLAAAKQRGDLPPTVDIGEAAAQLAGPLFTQHVMVRTTISDDLIANTTKQFLVPHH